MALGGYKFAGYKISKDADGAWDAAWALKAHRARIKAFRSACELSSSWGSDKWHYDSNWMSGDTTDGEATPSSVIYYTDPSNFEGYGYNLITFYQWGSESKYLAIVTLGYQTSGYANDEATCKARRGSASWYFGWSSQQLFHVLSYEPFTSVDFMKTGETYPTKALSLYPTKGYSFSATSVATLTPAANASNGALYRSSLYFGYAVREKSITSILSTSSWFSATKDKFDVTLFAFDAMSLSSPNDTANVLAVCPQYINQTSYLANLSTNSATNPQWPNATSDTLKDNYERYITTESSRQGSSLYLSRKDNACFSATAQSIPYESITLTASVDRLSAPYLNSDGITSKGTISIEYFATNQCYTYASEKPVWTRFANGNYLCVYVNPSTYALTQFNYYIGWDPSNPDITSEDAWTAYTG